MNIKGNDKIKQYLNNVCSEIKFKEVHKDIVSELEDHIQSFSEDNLENGLTEDAAINKAIAQMGDPHLVGKQLNIIHKPKPEWSILLLTLLFSMFGLTIMYLLENKSIHDNHYSYYPLFQTSLISYIVGIIIITALYFFNYRKLLLYSKYIYLTTVFLLVFTNLFGRPVSGIPFLQIGSIIVNFISISPIFLITALAGIFRSWNWKNSRNFILGVLTLFLPCFLILKGSIFNLAIYLAACFVIMYASKAKLSHICIIAVGLIMSIIFYFLSEPYRIKRFFSFLHPNVDPNGGSWLYLQLKNATSSAGILGRGFTLKTNSIPNIQSDFVLTYIIYTFGWAVASIFILSIIFFIVRLYKSADETKDPYGKLLIKGFSSIFFLKFLSNILVNLGLAPTAGVSLPFISYGRYELLSYMIMIGLILSVYRRKNLSPTTTKSEAFNIDKYKNSYLHKLIMAQGNNNLYENREFSNTNFIDCDLSNAEIKNCNISGLKVNGVPVEKLLDNYNKEES